MWADRYDRDLKDIFALQDEITLKVITALQVKLTEGEQARLMGKGTDNLEAYLKYLRGREHSRSMNKDDNVMSRQMAEKAIALDSNYAAPYALLAYTYFMDVWFRSSKSPKESLARSFELAQKSLNIDDSLPTTHRILSGIYLQKRQYENAIAEAERALALDPNSADNHAGLGRVLYYAGRPEEAIQLFKKAIRLNPIPESFYLYSLGMVYIITGRYEEAITACRKALHTEPKNLFAHVVLAASYSLSGRQEDARAEAAEVVTIQPKFSLGYFAKTVPFKKQVDLERLVNALRKAGLK
ncbi:MAG: tetratricopeptide repeat protein [Deltaproteobacteria bacterium]|nr:tetratricopeptide repeat protein [Deltaproteobacteria bacterium]